MSHSVTRRDFLTHAAAAVSATALLGATSVWSAESAPLYKISLAQWSLHRAIFGKQIDNLDFAKVSKEEFGIDAIEYVNQFFKDKAKDASYIADMKQRASDHGVRSVLIMVDGEGQLGAADKAQRAQTVENHKKWVEAAAELGCHAVRVNAASSGSYDEQVER
ncbi:MAG: twin-arginine translocation signal domain-containing protein, partial [Planctomycetales bacterium]|nr:twin-arginine translocation signal domain-containing protein [Planctomycetales bacterium]